MSVEELADPVDLEGIDALVSPLLHEAGAMVLRHFRSPLLIEDKNSGPDFDPVTQADRSAEEYLRRELGTLFPGARIVGEEGGVTGPEGRVRWVIDPIDGTKAYVTGFPAWGVLVGLMIDGRPVAGWCRQPYLNETFAGVDGTGWLERNGSASYWRPAQPPNWRRPRCTPPTRACSPHLASRPPLRSWRLRCGSRDLEATVTPHCLLALGYIDLVVEASLQPYDIVAMIPIVEAAGGVITDPEGKPPVDGGFVIAAATPQLHAQALGLIGGGPPP